MNQEDLQYLSLVIAQLHVGIGRLERSLGEKDAELTKLKKEQQGDVVNIDKGKAGKGSPELA